MLLKSVLIWGQHLFTFSCLYVALIAVAGVLFQGDIMQCQMCNLTPLTWLPLWIWLIFHCLTTVLLSIRFPGTKWSSNVCHYFATFSFNMLSMIQLLIKFTTICIAMQWFIPKLLWKCSKISINQTLSWHWILIVPYHKWMCCFCHEQNLKPAYSFIDGNPGNISQEFWFESLHSKENGGKQLPKVIHFFNMLTFALCFYLPFKPSHIQLSNCQHSVPSVRNLEHYSKLLWTPRRL